MDKAPYFSVIVPIFNVEKYVSECIESVLQQEFTDFELLLVDDGSSDHSSAICDKFAAGNNRIKVVHQENAGASAARNQGIAQAKGKWLIFVDSDDYISDKKHMNLLHETIERFSPDLITYGYQITHEFDRQSVRGRGFKREQINGLPDQTSRLERLILTDSFAVSPWQYAVRRGFVSDHNLLFDTALKSEEDIEWIFRVFLAEPQLYALATEPYTYRVRGNSLTTAVRRSGFWKNRLLAMEKNLTHLAQCEAHNANRDLLYEYLAYQYYILLGEIVNEPDKNVRKAAFGEVRKLDVLLKYRGGRKVKLSRVIVKIFGIPLGARILNLYVYIHSIQRGERIRKG